MTTLSPHALYRSSIPLGGDATEALVLICSDRRYRAATEEFLDTHLGIVSYDLVAVPGGAYLISFADALPKQLKVGMHMLRFLVKNHGPRRIVLVAHQDCGRYAEGFASWLRKPGFSLEEKQRHDLHKAAKELNETFPSIPIDAYFARKVEGDLVEFESA